MFKTKSNITQLFKSMDKAGKNVLKPFRLPITALIYQDQELKNYKQDVLTTEYSVKLEEDPSSIHYQQVFAPYVQDMRGMFIVNLKQLLKSGDTITRKVVEEAVDNTIAELYSMLFDTVPRDTYAFRDSLIGSYTDDN